MIDRRAFFLSIAAVAAHRLVGANVPRPNIVLFFTDDLGSADLGCYGATDIRTPNIDRLARQGIRFTQCYSNAPVCSATRAALMTGRYQQRFGLETAIGVAQRGKGLTQNHITIARRLKEAGYRNGIFGKWHLGYDPEFSPLHHGFDEFFGILSGNVDYYSHRESNGEPDLYEGLHPVQKEGYMTDLLAERAVRFVDENAGRPFFLYVPFNAVHAPYQAPGRPKDTFSDGYQISKTATRMDYARMVESVDQAVGRVLRALQSQNLSQNTLVIFTNDNGGDNLSNSAPLFHRKSTLWEGGIRVPGIVRWPGRLPGGKTTAQVAISMDFAATILAAAGVQAPPSPPLDGMNLLPVLEGRKVPVERTLFWRQYSGNHKQKAVRKGNWKYLRDGRHEMLFDVARDPAERNELGYRHPGVLARLRSAVEHWENELIMNPAASSRKELNP